AGVREELSFDFGRRKPGRQRAGGHHMLRGNLVGGVIEVDEVATADVHSADAEASCSGVYQVEIYQTFESDLEGSSIIVAQSFWPHRRIKVWRPPPEVEETGRAEEQCVP